MAVGMHVFGPPGTVNYARSAKIAAASPGEAAVDSAEEQDHMAEHGLRNGAAAAGAALALLAVLGPVSAGAASRHTIPGDVTGPGTTDASRFLPGPCPRTPEPIKALTTARCGVLEVPESRARPRGRTIRLAVAVIPATSAKPAQDPVVFMSGGPGGETFGDIPFLVDSGLNRDRDLIIMAQRGNLYDKPNLACPELDGFYAKSVGLPSYAPQTEQLMLKAVKRCRDHLTSGGIDLSAYNSTENAADFADLRTALGIKQWNVYGHSYGSDLATTYLRLHLQGIRAVALDSFTPPQSVSLPFAWAGAKEGLDNLFKACAAEPRCKSRYPNLARTLNEQVTKLEVKPLTLNVRPPQGGDPVKVVLDGGALVNVLVAKAIPLVDVPAAIEELGRGHPERFARARASGSVQVVGQMAYGLTNSVVCSEWVPGHPASDVLNAGRRAFPDWPDSVLAQAPQLTFQNQVCRLWNVPDRTATQRVAPVSSVPTLFLNGTFDMKTGASWAQKTARTLPRSTTVEVPGIGHWVVPQSPCAQKVLASFFTRPTAPDTGCVASLRWEPFTITPK
ncbi:alpha/beta fold hydrolase [Streptomyces camelliae]|uniref:Alpha/beta fold hydrolase n=1 Tax=Streptomyces camelliae TaxID=3004093 RepID=A0ABY7PDL2_9ACTN|nr:alpha/beta fold hydrolase [Streptomyces sp. HUAS 2-6]WBO66378.1 alpha/beta fold hydrolase [Streptomyces sp. HUAS 2-6]